MIMMLLWLILLLMSQTAQMNTIFRIIRVNPGCAIKYLPCKSYGGADPQAPMSAHWSCKCTTLCVAV